MTGPWSPSMTWNMKGPLDVDVGRTARLGPRGDDVQPGTRGDAAVLDAHLEVGAEAGVHPAAGHETYRDGLGSLVELAVGQRGDFDGGLTGNSLPGGDLDGGFGEFEIVRRRGNRQG